jgi:Zn-finger nucleic acid-binding protein
MTYRDRLLTCPHCGAALGRPKPARETWPCNVCHGIAIHRGELHRLLARFADDISTYLPLDMQPRPTHTPPRACPACNEKMTAMTLVGVPVDRCAKDDLVWFDPQELEATINSVIAEHDARKGWARKLRELLFAN